jgi:hypothetical protein
MMVIALALPWLEGNDHARLAVQGGAEALLPPLISFVR